MNRGLLGFPARFADRFQTQPVGDGDAFVFVRTAIIELRALLTAPRVLVLPAGALLPKGWTIRLLDAVGGITATNTLTFQPRGSDLIDGGSSLVLTSARFPLELTWDGEGRWTSNVGPAALTQSAADIRYPLRPRLLRTITSASSAADRTLTAADAGGLIIFSGTTNFTVTFDPAASLGNGWAVDFKQDGRCTVTHDPDGSEQIDGATTLVTLFRQTGRIYCTGSAFHTAGIQKLVVLESATVNSVAQVDFLLPPGYFKHIIEITGLIPGTNSNTLRARLSTDGGSTFLSGSTDYASAVVTSNISGSNAFVGSAWDAANAAQSNSQVRSGSWEIYGARNASIQTLGRSFFADWRDAVGRVIGNSTNDRNGVSQDNNAIRIFYNSGTLSGSFTLMGVQA